MKLEIEYVDINSIRPYKNNAKQHPREQIEQIKRSIEEFGMDDPIGIWKDEIVEGHGRLIACKELGYKEVPIIRLDHLTDEQRKAYTLAHNKLTMNSDFDLDILNRELMSFDTIDMSEFGFDLDEETEAPAEVEEVDIPEIMEEPVSKPGDIFQIGEHRLMCGDSTNEMDVEKLMNGEIADLVVTDPPYNVNVSNSDGLQIENDNLADYAFRELLDKSFHNLKESLKEGGAFYIWYGDTEDVNFRLACKENELSIRQCLIWVKNSLNLGRQDYKWMHEPCLYGWREGAGHYFIEEFNHTTVIEDKVDLAKMKKEDMKKMLEEILASKVPTTVIHENKPSKNDLHPTMKPIKLIAQLVRNSSKKGELVLDLFGGSGSTLITCEQLGRRCNMMEYDPVYADVIIKRWENYTGKKAVKING